MAFTGNFLQVFFAIILVIGFLLIGFAIYNFEMLKSIQKFKSVQLTTPIFQGVVDFNTMGTYTYNTINPNNPLDTTYRNLGNAINQAGGAEFTYNFWLYMDPSAGTSGTNNKIVTTFFDPKKNSPKTINGTYTTDFGLNTDQFILFLRGTNSAVVYDSLCGTTKKSDIMVKCPLVKLENAGDVLSVEFNTVQTKDKEGRFRGADAVSQNARNTCSDVSNDWSYKNSYKIGIKNLKATYPAQWFMVTLVIMDTYPSDPLPIRDKSRCQIYINGAIQLDTYVDGMLNPPNTAGPSILLQNQGNLYVGPAITYTNPQIGSIQSTIAPGSSGLINQPRSLCMADLTFMNYVPTPGQITTMYSSGFTKSYASPPSAAPQQMASAFMNKLSTNTNPDVVSQIYTATKQ